MSRPIIHQQIEYLLKKINEQHAQMQQKETSISQEDMDSMMQNLRQLYEAVLVLYQNNTFAALEEMNAAAEQQILAEKRANELRQAQQKTEEPPIKTPALEEIIVQEPPMAEEIKIDKPKTKKPTGNVNASLFENVPTVGGKYGSEDRLHTKIAAKSTGETVAHKMHRHPVKDLKAAIGINEKFLFINKLFDGNGQQYNDAIERINNSGSHSAAKRIIDEELFPKYDWQTDSEPVKEFLELVERRFIS
jgi:hypothetical protein